MFKLIVDKSLSHFLFVGTALSVSFLGTGCNSTPKADATADAAPQAVPVRVKQLQPGTIQESSEFVGNLEAVKIVEVLPEVEGRIERVLVNPGQRVRAGQTIMLLKPGKVVPQHKADLVKIDIAKKNYENAQKKLDIVKAKLDTTKAEYTVTSNYVPRVQKLAEAGAIAQIKLDETLQKQVAAKNNFVSVQQEVAAAQIDVKQAEDNIRQAKAQADVSLINLQSKAVVSPIAGIVDQLPAKQGSYLNAGQSVVAKIAQTEALELNIAVPSNRSNNLKKGLVVELFDPVSKKKLTSGSLSFISPTINTEGQTILTKARFRNVQGKLRHGQNVRARIIWNNQTGVLIPTTAVSQSGNVSFIYLAKPGEKGQTVAKLVPVKLGNIQGSDYQVISGVKPGDRVAVSNILKLRDGVPVQPEAE